MTPVEHSTKPRVAGRMGTLLPWIGSALAGLLFSLSYPNELIPGWLGDHPPFIVGWIALLPFLWAIFTLTGRQAVLAGWLFGFTSFLGILCWMRLFDLLPWLGLTLAVSVFIPLSIWLMQRMRLPEWLSPFGLALAWSGVEWLRGQSIFGFPWGEVGASQVDGLTGKMAALGSVHLISFLMIWITGTLVLRLMKRPLPRRLLPVMCAVLLVCLLSGWWQARQAVVRWNAQTRTQVFALVQPNGLMGLTPKMAFQTHQDPYKQVRRLNATLGLSYDSLQAPLVQQADTRPMVVWPESAMRTSPLITSGTIGFCLSQRSYLLAGAPAFPPEDMRFRNAAYVMGPNAEEIGRYDKIHLVPFGEFVPFRGLVDGLRRHGIVPDVRDNDIKPGTQWTPITAGGHRLGIGICFESTFPAIARRYAAQQAHYLIYITNDAWFHRTAAVRQHFNHSRFRALESGLPVVRVAETGISGFIAPDGTILDEIPTYTEGYRIMRLPEGTAGTVYSRVGWLFAPLCLLISLLFVARGVFMTRRDSSRKRT